MMGVARFDERHSRDCQSHHVFGDHVVLVPKLREDVIGIVRPALYVTAIAVAVKISRADRVLKEMVKVI